MSRTGLQRFGVMPPTVVREPTRDGDDIPVCPECGHPVTNSKGVYTRRSQRTGGTAMSSRASELESSKASGDALEAEIVQTIDPLEYVGDRTATWHDARTTAVLEASQSLPFYGIVLVKPNVPVEIKGCQIETSNGTPTLREHDNDRQMVLNTNDGSK